MRRLFRSHRSRLAAVGVPQAGLLDDRLAVPQRFGLACQFVVDRILDRLERVHVLDLNLGAEGSGRIGPNRHVGIAAEAAFLHVAIADFQELEDGSERAQISTGLGRGAEIGLADDFQQRHAAAIVVDQTAVAAGVVDVLAGVLFHVDAGQTDALRLFINDDVEPAVFADRQLEHADLVVFRQVRVEVVLAREHRARRDRAVGRQSGTDRELDDPPVQRRQRAGHAQAHRADVGVGVCAETRRAPAKDLRLGQQLGVHFQADDRVIGRCHRGGACWCHVVAA